MTSHDVLHLRHFLDLYSVVSVLLKQGSYITEILITASTKRNTG